MTGRWVEFSTDAVTRAQATGATVRIVVPGWEVVEGACYFYGVRSDGRYSLNVDDSTVEVPLNGRVYIDLDTLDPTAATVITVTFTDGRVGRARDVPPLETDATDPLGILAAVEAYARRYLGSRDVDSDYYPSQGHGVVYAGMRPVAQFTVDPLPPSEDGGDPARVLPTPQET